MKLYEEPLNAYGFACRKRSESLMFKLILLSTLVVGVMMLVLRKVPRLRVYTQRLLQNPIVRTILFRGLWRLIRLLIFRR